MVEGHEAGNRTEGQIAVAGLDRRGDAPRAPQRRAELRDHRREQGRPCWRRPGARLTPTSPFGDASFGGDA